MINMYEWFKPKPKVDIIKPSDEEIAGMNALFFAAYTGKIIPDFNDPSGWTIPIWEKHHD